jgi:hypothetical protein
MDNKASKLKTGMDEGQEGVTKISFSLGVKESVEVEEFNLKKKRTSSKEEGKKMTIKKKPADKNQTG